MLAMCVQTVGRHCTNVYVDIRYGTVCGEMKFSHKRQFPWKWKIHVHEWSDFFLTCRSALNSLWTFWTMLSEKRRGLFQKFLVNISKNSLLTSVSTNCGCLLVASHLQGAKNTIPPVKLIYLVFSDLVHPYSRGALSYNVMLMKICICNSDVQSTNISMSLWKSYSLCVKVTHKLKSFVSGHAFCPFWEGVVWQHHLFLFLHLLSVFSMLLCDTICNLVD